MAVQLHVSRGRKGETMPLANCVQCKKLFNKVKNELCQECLEKEERLLRLIHDHLRKTPKISLAQLIDDFAEIYDIELEESQIEKWVAEKRINLILPGENSATPRCQLCGREVKQGESICRTCKFTKLGRAGDKQKKPASNEPQAGNKIRGMYYKRWGSKE